MLSKIRAVFFDLDGTLVDTAPDLIHALNLLLAEIGRTAAPPEDIRPHVSAGVKSILTAGLKPGPDEDVEIYRARYLQIYEDNLSVYSGLFEGMEKVLSFLENKSMPWGIVTNKPSYLTDQLLQQIKLSHRCCTAISADTTPFRKPHPAPLLEACKRCRLEPQACVYIGDDQRDIHAGNAAGMLSLAAAWGYYLPTDNIEDWPARAVLQKPEDLIDWI